MRCKGCGHIHNKMSECYEVVHVGCICRFLDRYNFNAVEDAVIELFLSNSGMGYYECIAQLDGIINEVIPDSSK
jgi:hypothetical protein